MQGQLSDIEHWEALLNGDSQAFAEIYKRYVLELLTYGNRLTSDRQLVRDTVQSLFLNIWERRERLSATDSVKFYLFKALRNRITNERLKGRELLTVDFTSLGQEQPRQKSFEQLIIENEVSQLKSDHLRAAIRKLPSRQREVIQLRYYHNLSTEQIAELMQINNQSARNLLHRSILQLRDFFSNLPQNWIAGPLFFLFV